MMILAEDVLIELGQPDWNQIEAKRAMVTWLQRHGFDALSSVCEAADTWRRTHKMATPGELMHPASVERV